MQTDLERLMSKVIKSEDGCWFWQGGTTGHGDKSYGQFWYKGKLTKAHRAAFEIITGDMIPEGFELDHLCKNRLCVNPAHLDLVTHKENYSRTDAGHFVGDFQKAKSHCPKGHPYNAENTYLRSNEGGGKRRLCKLCEKERTHQKYLKRQAVLKGG